MRVLAAGRVPARSSSLHPADVQLHAHTHIHIRARVRTSAHTHTHALARRQGAFLLMQIRRINLPDFRSLRDPAQCRLTDGIHSESAWQGSGLEWICAAFTETMLLSDSEAASV